MDTKFYRVLTAEAFNRIPKEGIHGPLDSQRFSIDGLSVIVQRAEGFSVNSRWISQNDAILLTSTPEWNEQDEP